MENVCDTVYDRIEALNNPKDIKFHCCKQNVESSNIKKVASNSPYLLYETITLTDARSACPKLSWRLLLLTLTLLGIYQSYLS